MDEGISPAALGAIQKGEFGNAMAALLPGGIERQEAEGQRTFVASDSLPVDGIDAKKQAELEAMGFVFGDLMDGLFIECKLPPGWKKVATNHSMWSELVDDQGKEQAMIFYKAAFYDRKAFIQWTGK